MGAAADCETIASGFFGQPVNAWSTLAFVAAGFWVLSQRPRARWIGIALVATGIGSFLFHGPMPPGNQWAHDATLAWVLVVIAGFGTRWESLSRLPAAFILAVLTFLLPSAADPLAVPLSIVAVASVLWRVRLWVTVGPLLLAGAAGLYGRLGATGGPLCDPDALWQPHAVWHLAAATAVGWLAARPANEWPGVS